MKHSRSGKRMEKMHNRFSDVPKLNLVSLMDIFTILVFFLMFNSSESESLQSNKDVSLPTSTAKTAPSTSLVVMVANDDLLVGGRKIDSITQQDRVLAKGVFEGLKKELEYQNERAPALTEMEIKTGRKVTIMADASVPYTLLKKIMKTCGNTAYRNLSFAVSQMDIKNGSGVSADQKTGEG